MVLYPAHHLRYRSCLPASDLRDVSPSGQSDPLPHLMEEISMLPSLEIMPVVLAYLLQDYPEATVLPAESCK